MSASGGQVAAAVLLPPLGVFLRRGGGRAFWTATVLTMVGWLPGLAFSLWTVLRGDGDGASVRG